MSRQNRDKPVVFVVCTGLGHVFRGYESFTEDFFLTLRDHQDFDLIMLKGAGSSKEKELRTFCIKRNSAMAAFWSSLCKRDPYWIEQFTFMIGMLPHLNRYKPQVIYFNDVKLGRFLFHLKKRFKFKYKLLFCNGSPLGPPYETEDHIQQPLPMYVNMALAFGTPAHKMTLLPWPYHINKDENNLRIAESKKWREKLQLPADKKIVITVGAVNTHHKRIDYVIDEFSKLDQNKYFLIVLGQLEAQSAVIIKQAADKLQSDSYVFKRVNNADVQLYLGIADYFILASLNEGLPRALAEALINGLTPIVHDYEVTRQTAGEFGVFKDMTKENTLLRGIQEVDLKNYSKADIINFAWENYSWDKLRDSYLDMITRVLN